MRSALWSVLLCGVVGAAAAQETEVSFEEPKPVAVTGFAVGTVSYDRNHRENTAAGSKLAVSLFRPWSEGLYLFAQLTTHLDEDEATGEPHTEIEIDNLLLSWTPPGLSSLNLWFGRFDAPIGFERDDEPLNLQPTGSFNFEFARPVKFTGALARYVASPRLALSAYVANGWNEELDNNSGKTAGLRLQLLPVEGAAVGLNAVYGPEQEGTNGAQRTLLAGDATLQPVRRLILGFEVNHGRQREAGTSLTWTGAVGTAFLRLGRSTGITVRGEILDDADGAATGQAQTLKSLTIAPMYFYREAQEGIFSTIEHTDFRLPAFAIRPGIRFDTSDVPYFEDAAGNLVRDNFTAVIELVYVF